MNDPLIEAIDAARECRPSDLYDIVGWMIVRKASLPDEVLDEVRAEVCVGVAKLIHKNALTIDIARQAPTIIRRRLADYFESQRRKSEDEPEVVSLEALDGYDPSSPVDVAAIVEEHIVPGAAQAALLALRDSRDERDRRDYLILEAHIGGTLSEARIQEIMNKEVSDTYMSTLLYRAKQRLTRMYESAGGRRIGA